MGKNLDPEAHVMILRIAAVRRIWHREPAMRPKIREAIEIYIRERHPGAEQSGEGDPAPGQADRAPNIEGDMHGPVGLLIASCHRFGFRMDARLVIRAPGERAIDILKHPIQQVRPFFLEAIARATCARAMSCRKAISCN
eukprot:2835382-Alexandrium_andersonii.AAC.1